MISLLAAFTAGSAAATGYAIRQVRVLRRQLERTNSTVFKAQVRRAQQFNQFCEPCKQIINPHWIGGEMDVHSAQFRSTRQEWVDL